jgi:preprotein translocase subunit SecD
MIRETFQHHLMNRTLYRFLATLLLLVCPALAGDKKGKNIAVSFHMETDANNNPKNIYTQTVAGKVRYFQKAPDITSKDIVAFSPFLADNGVDYGAVFRLRASAASRLENITAANQGRMLAAVVNGRFVDNVIIDQPIKDGFIVIWNGIQDAELKEYDKLVPRIGKEKK